MEDDDLVRQVATDTLRRAGYDVIQAEDAEQALALLEESEVTLVVTDVGLPGRSGLELLADVRRSRARVPILLTSGSASESLHEEATGNGAAGLIAKPWRPPEFLAAVASAIEDNEQGTADG